MFVMGEKMRLFPWLKNFTAAVIILFFVIPSIISSSAVETEKRSQSTKTSNLLYVGGSGEGNFSSIMDAVNASVDGDCILVYPGIYYEHLVLNVSISLISVEGMNVTVIDANRVALPLRVFADSCKIDGFTFQNGGDLGYNYTASVSLRCDNCIFTNNTVSMRDVHQIHADSAIEILGNNSKISNCRLLENDENPLIQRGVYIDQYSSNCYLYDNYIEGFASGIYSYYFTNEIIIENNSIESCKIGVFAQGSVIKIVRNTIRNCSGSAVSLFAPNSYVAFNDMICKDSQYNGCVFVYTSAKESVIEKNCISGNTNYGIYLVDPYKCIVRSNDILQGNIFVFKYLNTLWKTYQISGNYYAEEKLNCFGWQILPGNLQIIAYFEASWDTPWFGFDKNPLSSPVFPS